MLQLPAPSIRIVVPEESDLKVIPLRDPHASERHGGFRKSDSGLLASLFEDRAYFPDKDNLSVSLERLRRHWDDTEIEIERCRGAHWIPIEDWCEL